MMKSLKQRITDYGIFLRHQWRPMLGYGTLVGLAVWGAYLTSNAVDKIVDNAEGNRIKLETLINKTDKNSRELECIKKALGLEASVSREEFERCQREVQQIDGTVPREPGGLGVTGTRQFSTSQSANGQNVQAGVVSGGGNTTTPPPPFIDVLGLVQVNNNPANELTDRIRRP